MKKTFLFTLFLAFLSFSCKNEKQTINNEDLVGIWEMISAKRNGKTTSTLDKSFFKFENGTVSHNINGDTISNSYTMQENNIIVNNDIIENLEIEFLSIDSLEMETKISNMKFEFIMKKINE